MDNSARPVCHFLRIPQEIRLSIYRELLIPSPMIYFGKGESFGGPESEWDDEMDGMGEMDGMDVIDELDAMDEMDDFGYESDSSSSGPSSSDPDSDVDMRGGGKEYITAGEAPALAYGDKYKMYPAILRTSKQVYAEASSLLYTEGVIVLEVGDIFCLSKAPLGMFGVPYHGAWRHNPLHGLGRDVNGVVTYDTAAMDGKMDPHVFARFQKVYFDANFNAEHTDQHQLWIDDDTHVVKREDAEGFMDTLRQSTIMTDFVELISKSPRIMKLEVVLELEMMANSNLIEDMNNTDDDGADDDDETEKKIDKLMGIADEKATELFLDSGICECLKQLSNVQTLHFKLGFDDRTDEEAYKPLPKHLTWIQELKKTVERTFKDPVI